MDFFRRFTFLVCAPAFDADELEGSRLQQIIAAVEKLQSDAVDVVVAERRKRSEPWYFRMSYFFTGYFFTDRREYPFWNFLCTLLVRSETFCFAAVGPPARLVGSFLVT